MKVDWATYAVHNEKEIRGFFGPYRYLSNYEELRVPVAWGGFSFSTTEHAYQAAKSLDSAVHLEFASLKTPGEARKRGQEIKIRPNWEAVKFEVMKYFVIQKFERNLELADKLLNTGDAFLEEKNHWSDVYWGVNLLGIGQNNLGKILMLTRDLLR